MKKLLTILSLVLLSAPFTARADDECAGKTVAIHQVEDDNGGPYPANIYLNYNNQSDTYCATMDLTGNRKGKPTYGLLLLVACKGGLDKNNQCPQQNQVALQQKDDGTRTHFGPIRAAGNNRCILASGALRYRDDGEPFNARGHTSWRCERGQIP